MPLNDRATIVGAFLAVVAVAFAVQHTPASAAERYIDEVFSSVTVTSNLAYGQAIDEFGQPETLRLDVYQPAGDVVLLRPVILFAHGGSFTGGDKGLPDPTNYSTRMAKRGYVVASINYRLRENGYPPEEQAAVVLDAKHDMQAAVRWFRANAATYKVDPDRISVAGYSAGAGTALFAAYTSNDPGDSGNPGYASTVSAVISVSGGMGNNPGAFIDPGEPPVLLIHGTADATVPYSNATNIVAAANADGVPNELHTLQGAEHSKFGPTLMPEMAQASADFLYAHVVNPAGVGGFATLASVDDSLGSGGPALVWWLAPTAVLLCSFGAGVVLFVRRR